MKEKTRSPIRVLMTKVGLDGHERGARVVSFGLRDEGMEVIYTGIRQNIESIVSVAIQEDVDVVGLSSLSGAHDLFPEIVKQLKEKVGGDILVIGCHADTDDLDICECGSGFGNGTITITQDDCENQVDYDCITGCS